MKKKISKKQTKKGRPAGRPPKGSTNASSVIRSVILKNPHMKWTAIRDMAFDMLGSDFSPALVNQVGRTLPSFFLREATQRGLRVEQLIEFLKICEQYPSKMVAEGLESRCFEKKSKKIEATRNEMADLLRRRFLKQMK